MGVVGVKSNDDPQTMEGKEYRGTEEEEKEA